MSSPRLPEVGGPPPWWGAPASGGVPHCQCTNVNQLRFTKSAGWPLVNVTYTLCVPVTPLMFAGTVRQLCQPPVLPTAKLPIGALDRLSSRTSTSPLTPPPAPDATRAWKFVAALPPKSTFG